MFERRKFLKFLLTSGIVLSGTGSALPLISGCKGKKEVNVEKYYKFLDHLHEAVIVTPKKSYVQKHFALYGGGEMGVLFEHPDSRVTFNDVPIYQNARLSFGIVISEAVWDKEGDGVLFEIILSDEKSNEHSIYQRYIDPKNNPEDRKWFDEVVSLEAFEGKKASFTFKTSSGPKGNEMYDPAFWREPQIVHSVKKRASISKRTNVVFISIDSLRPDHMGCYGYEKNTTPNLDNFAAEGIQFMRVVCPYPNILFSHLSILTSLYPDVHRVFPQELMQISAGKGDVELDPSLDPKWTTLAEVMQGRGYQTVGFARSCGWMDGRFGLDQGFDLYSVTNEIAEQVNQSVISWLGDHMENNFFLFIHYHDVHSVYSPSQKLPHPYASPPPYNKMFLPEYKGAFTGCGEKGCSTDHLTHINTKGDILPPEDLNYIAGMYDGGIRYTDFHVGELLKTIERLRLRENTLVIITSGHGEEFQEHGKFLHTQLYNEVVRVPLIMRYPKKIPAQKKNYDLVESIDILPTILDLVNIKHVDNFQGKSLFPLINGTEARKTAMAYLTGGSKKGVIKDKWNLIYDFRTQKKELYDLSKDPGQNQNLVSTHKEIVEDMMATLRDWMKANTELRKRVKKAQ
jgi:arylsulfatase A-like enzyme